MNYVTVGKDEYLLEVPESLSGSVPRDYELCSSRKVKIGISLSSQQVDMTVFIESFCLAFCDCSLVILTFLLGLRRSYSLLIIVGIFTI